MRDVYLFKSYMFCGSCIDDVRTQLDKLGRRPLLTDHEIDQEVYPLKLAKASGEEPEDWDMECCMCEHPLEFVSLPRSEEKERIRRDIDIHELGREQFVEGFADGYGLVQGTRHRAWELYIEWLESAMMDEDIRYHMEGKGYGMGFAAGMSARGDQ
jgi:hypothetical protein